MLGKGPPRLCVPIHSQVRGIYMNLAVSGSSRSDRVVCRLDCQSGRPKEETKDLCIKLSKVATEKDSKKVQKEIQLLSSITHPNIVNYKGRTTKGISLLCLSLNLEEGLHCPSQLHDHRASVYKQAHRPSSPASTRASYWSTAAEAASMSTSKTTGPWRRANAGRRLSSSPRVYRQG
jgi:hypothetical protein